MGSGRDSGSRDEILFPVRGIEIPLGLQSSPSPAHARGRVRGGDSVFPLNPLPAVETAGYYQTSHSAGLGSLCRLSGARPKFTITTHETLSSLTLGSASCRSNSRRLSDQLTPRRHTTLGRDLHTRRAS